MVAKLSPEQRREFYEKRKNFDTKFAVSLLAYTLLDKTPRECVAILNKLFHAVDDKCRNASKSAVLETVDSSSELDIDHTVDAVRAFMQVGLFMRTVIELLKQAVEAGEDGEYGYFSLPGEAVNARLEELRTEMMHTRTELDVAVALANKLRRKRT